MNYNWRNNLCTKLNYTDSDIPSLDYMRGCNREEVLSQTQLLLCTLSDVVQQGMSMARFLTEFETYKNMYGLSPSKACNNMDALMKYLHAINTEEEICMDTLNGIANY